MMDNQPFSSAARRNQQPILDVLKTYICHRGTVLEIGSGTGQHAVFFTQNLPGLSWQPSDRLENLAGLAGRFLVAGNDRILV